MCFCARSVQTRPEAYAPATKGLHSKRQVSPDDTESETSDAADEYSDSALDISLKKDRELVLVADTLPSMKRDSIVLALLYKGIKFVEATVEEGDLPTELREVCCRG